MSVRPYDPTRCSDRQLRDNVRDLGLALGDVSEPLDTRIAWFALLILTTHELDARDLARRRRDAA